MNLSFGYNIRWNGRGVTGSVGLCAAPLSPQPDMEDNIYATSVTYIQHYKKKCYFPRKKRWHNVLAVHLWFSYATCQFESVHPVTWYSHLLLFSQIPGLLIILGCHHWNVGVKDSLKCSMQARWWIAGPGVSLKKIFCTSLQDSEPRMLWFEWRTFSYLVSQFHSGCLIF